MYSLACKDAGMPECNYVAMGETKEGVIKMSKDHLMKAHPKKAEEMQEKMSDEETDEELEKHIMEKEEDDI